MILYAVAVGFYITGVLFTGDHNNGPLLKSFGSFLIFWAGFVTHRANHEAEKWLREIQRQRRK